MLPLLLACQEPFPEDRHDLVSFRIAALSAEQKSEGLALSALISSDEGFYHSKAPTLTWTLGTEVQLGADPLFPVPTSWPVRIGLRAESEGQVEEAFFALQQPPLPPIVSAWSREKVSLKLEDAAKPVEDRRLEGVDLPLEPGGAAQLSLTTNARSHWMGTGGEFAELDGQSSTWFAGNYQIDDEDVVDPVPLQEEIYHLVALSFDEQGGNRLSFMDVAVGEQQVVAAGGRLLPTDGAISEEGWYSALFVADDSSTGFLLSALEPTTPQQAPALCGAAEAQPFDPIWLLDGSCGRDDLEGERVVIWGAPWP